MTTNIFVGLHEQTAQHPHHGLGAPDSGREAELVPNSVGQTFSVRLSFSTPCRFTRRTENDTHTFIPVWIIGGPFIGILLLSFAFKGPSAMCGSLPRIPPRRVVGLDPSAPLFDPFTQTRRDGTSELNGRTGT